MQSQQVETRPPLKIEISGDAARISELEIFIAQISNMKSIRDQYFADSPAGRNIREKHPNFEDFQDDVGESRLFSDHQELQRLIETARSLTQQAAPRRPHS